jgi:lecithin-cholesterol acyltransferase
MPTLDATIRRRLSVGALIACLLLVLSPASAVGRGDSSPAAAQPGNASGAGLTPIVLFPAWHFTRLTVVVNHQRTDPSCPSSGTFEDLVFEDPGPTFSQVCRDELLTLRYNAKAHQPIRLRFSEQPGVTVSIADYGRNESAPFYEAMY